MQLAVKDKAQLTEEDKAELAEAGTRRYAWAKTYEVLQAGGKDVLAYRPKTPKRKPCLYQSLCDRPSAR